MVLHTIGELAIIMNKTSRLRVTMSWSAIFRVAVRADRSPSSASWMQNSLFLWATFAKTLNT